jgi:hypothetical protein
MRQLTNEEHFAINNVEKYSIDFQLEADSDEYSEKLEQELIERAEAIILEATNFTDSDDLGGLTIYFKDDKLVAFYDYEQYLGTVFTN